MPLSRRPGNGIPPEGRSSTRCLPLFYRQALYGTGFYGAIDMGANVYQNRGGDRTFTDDRLDTEFFGDTLTISPKNDVGFFGGIKLGYVFGTGVVRPTVEGDFFYNGFRGGADFTLKDSAGNVLQSSNLTTWINTARSWRTSYSRPE